MPCGPGRRLNGSYSQSVLDIFSIFLKKLLKIDKYFINFFMTDSTYQEI